VTVAGVVEHLALDVLAEGDLSTLVTGGYCSDLLSDVLAHAGGGDVWITHQRHMNVVAVAKLKEVAAVVIVRGAAPNEQMVERARAEGVNLLMSGESAFQAAGKLYRLLSG